MAFTSTFMDTVIKDRFIANGFIDGTQTTPDVLGLSNGGFAVAYNSQALGNGAITLDFYDANGQHVGTTKFAGQGVTNAIGKPSLTELANGGVLVTWDDDAAGEAGIRGRIYSANGEPQTQEFSIFGGTVLPGDPEIAALPGGGFVLTYELSGNVYMGRFNSLGELLGGGAFQVNAGVPGDQADGSIATFSNSRYVVTYTDTDPGDQTIRARIYNADGSTWVSDKVIATGGDNTQSKVVTLPNGNWAVVYTDSGWGEGGPLGNGITLQIFNQSGDAVSAPIQVNNASVVDESEPDIAVLPTGQILVTWTHPYSPTDRDIKGRAFSLDGEALTGPFIIDNSTSDEFVSAVSKLAGGSYVTVFQDSADDGGTETGQITAEIHALVRNTVGDGSSDTFIGDAMRDVVQGGGGQDKLFGGGNVDSLYGNTGDDELHGGEGNDFLDGGDGSDTLSYYGATTGMTLVMGSTGPNSGQVFAGDPIGMDTFANIEHVLCGNQADTVGADGAGNFIAGFGGDDTIFGWTGNDTLWGGENNDQLFGQQDNDIINGDAGNDKLFGWAGNDTLTGGSGADSFMWTGAGEGTDIITDYSYAQGDLIDVVGNPATFTFYQAGSSVLIIDPGTGQAIFNITNYELSNGLAIV